MKPTGIGGRLIPGFQLMGKSYESLESTVGMEKKRKKIRGGKNLRLFYGEYRSRSEATFSFDSLLLQD